MELTLYNSYNDSESMSSSSANTSENGASFNWNSGFIPNLLKEYKDDVPKFKIPMRSSYISSSKSK